MLKKFISYLTLVCFFNSSCIFPALASAENQDPQSKPVRVDLRLLPVNKDTDGRLVINGQQLLAGRDSFANNNEEYRFIFEGKQVGFLQNFEGHLSLISEGDHHFYLNQLPAIKSLAAQLSGSLTIENNMDCNDYLKLLVKGTTKLLKGFKIHKKRDKPEELKGNAIFRSQSLEVDGQSDADSVLLVDIDHLLLKQNASLVVDFIANLNGDKTSTKVPTKTIDVAGKLVTKESALETEEFTCTGSMKLLGGQIKSKTFKGQSDSLHLKDVNLVAEVFENSHQMELDDTTLHITKGVNKGSITAKNQLGIKGSGDKESLCNWHNMAGGTVSADKNFVGQFSDYLDEGKTDVKGIAQLKGQNGTVLSNFSAEEANLSFSTKLLTQGNVKLGKSSILTPLLDNRGKFVAKSMALNGELANHKEMEISEAVLNSKKVVNHGTLKIANATVQGQTNEQPTCEWHNMKGAVLLVEEFLQGKFSRYNDNGNTTVNGVLSVQADTGQLGGHLRGRFMTFNFNRYVELLKGAQIFVHTHFSLFTENPSKVNENSWLDIFSQITQASVTDWPKMVPTLKLNSLIEGKFPGIYISSKGSIRKHSNISSANSKVNIVSAADYEAKGGITSSGVFAGNHTAIAANAIRLFDHMQDVEQILQANKLVLNGFRQVEDVLRVIVKDCLVQSEEDKTIAGSIEGRTGSATLSGTIELDKRLNLGVDGHFETKDSFKLKGGDTSVYSGSAKIGGQLRDTNLQVVTKEELRLANGLDAEINSSYLKSGTIIHHEQDSSLKVAGSNTEDATIGIMLEKDALVKAASNTFIGGQWIWNSGSIESACRYLADTQEHYNINGGRINADQLIIYADRLNYNQLAILSGNYTEVNTSLNLNALGIMRGRQGLKVNALLANINAGAVVSSNYTSNSLKYFQFKGLTMGDISSPGDVISSMMDPRYIVPKVLTGATYVCAAAALPYVKFALLLWNAYGLYESVSRFCKAGSKGDEANRWRLSRVANRTGDLVAISLQAKMVIQEAMRYNEQFKPFEVEQPNKNQELHEAIKKRLEETQKPENQKSVITEFVEKMWNAPTELADDLYELAKENTGLLYTFAKDNVLNSIGGRAEINSLFHWDNGVNATGHISATSGFYYGDAWNATLTRDVSCYTGYDHNETWAYRDTTFAKSDFGVGGGKHITTDYTVKAGGDVVVEESTDIHAANSSIKADGKMEVKKGATAAGDNTVFESRGDMKFAGLTDAAQKTTIESTEGNVTLVEGADAKGTNVLVKAAKQAHIQEGANASGVVVKCEGEKGALVDGTMAGTQMNRVHSENGEARVGKTGSLEGQNNIVTGNTAVYEGKANGEFVGVGGIQSAKVSGEINAKSFIITASESEPVITSDAKINAESKQIFGPKDSIGGNGAANNNSGVDSTNSGSITPSQVPTTAPIAANVETKDTPVSASKPDNSALEDEKQSAVAGVYWKMDNSDDPTCDAADGGTKTEETSLLSSLMSSFTMKSNLILAHIPGMLPSKDKPKKTIKVKKEEGNGHGKGNNSGHTKKPAKAHSNEPKETQAPTTENKKELEEPKDEPTPPAETTASVTESNADAETAIVPAGDPTQAVANQKLPVELVAEEVHWDGSNKAAIINPTFQNDDDFLDFIMLQGKYESLSQIEMLSILMDEPVHFQQPGSYKFPSQGHMYRQVERAKRATRKQHDKDVTKLNKQYKNHLSKDYLKAWSQLENKFVKDMNRLEHTRINIILGKEITPNPTILLGYDHFTLVSPQITVAERLNLLSPGQLYLYSTDEKFVLGAGSTVGAAIYLYVNAPAGIKWEHNTIPILGKSKHNEGVPIGVNFEAATFFGGVGLPALATDPITGEIVLRNLGLLLETDRKAKGVAGNFISCGGDIQIIAPKGFVNEAAKQLYLSDYDHEGRSLMNGYTEKEERYYETKFSVGLLSTPGRFTLLCDKGGCKIVGGVIQVGDGAVIITRDNIEFLDKVGKQGYVKTKDGVIPFLDSEDKKIEGLNETVSIFNHGESKFYMYAVDSEGNKSGKIYFTGRYVGNCAGEKGGTLYIKGKKLKLTRRVLNNHSSSKGAKFSHESTNFTKKSVLGKLKALKGLMQDLGMGNIQGGLLTALGPSIKVGLSFGSSEDTWQTLGAGSILESNIVLDLDEMTLENGFEVRITKDGDINVGKIYLHGVELVSTSKSESIGLFAGLSAGGASYGLSYKKASSIFKNWIKSTFVIEGKATGSVGLVDEDAGKFEVLGDDSELNIDERKTIERHDSSESTSIGIEVGNNGAAASFNHQKNGNGFNLDAACGSDGKGSIGAGGNNGDFNANISLDNDGKTTLAASAKIDDLTLDGSVSSDGSGSASASTPDFSVAASVDKESKTTLAASAKIDDLTLDGSVSSDGSGSASASTPDFSVAASVDKESKTTLAASAKIDDLTLDGSVSSDGSGSASATTPDFSVAASVDKDNKTTIAGIAKIDDLTLDGSVSSDGSGSASASTPDYSAIGTIDHNGQVSAQVESIKHQATVGGTYNPNENSVTVALGENIEDPLLEHTFDLKKPAAETAHTPTTQMQSEPKEEDVISDSHSIQTTTSEHRNFVPLDQVLGHVQNTLNPGQSGSDQGLVPFGNTTSEEPTGMIPIPANNDIPLNQTTHGLPPQPLLATGVVSWVPISTSMIEALSQPIVYNGVEFKYRVAGTNIYVQDPHMPLEKMQQYFNLKESPSWYGQRAFAGLSNEETAVFWFADERIPKIERRGLSFTEPSLAGKKPSGPAGSQTLGNEHIALGTEQTPGANSRHIPGHEGGHRWVKKQTGGDVVPGYVPANATLSDNNLGKLFSAYSNDAKELGYVDLKSIPRELADVAKFEFKTMFYDPFQIFVQNFKKGLAADGIQLSPYEMDMILKQAHHDIFNGRVPSQQNHYLPAVQRALDQGEQHMAAEIYALYTEVDIHKPGFVASKSPKTHGVFEEFVGGKVPTGQGSLKPHWYQRPLAKGIFKAMPVVALAGQVGANYVGGSDLPNAIADGVTDFAIDAVVYTPVFSLVAYGAGGPVSLCLGSVGLIAELAPGVPIEQWTDAANRMEHALQIDDKLAYERACQDMEDMGGQQAFKDIFSLKPVRDWLKEKMDVHFPKFRSEFSVHLYALGQGWEQVQIAQINETREIMGLPPLPVKSGEEIQRNVENYRHVNQPKAHSSDKGKEEL
jgi:hypothetical protein